MTRSERANVGFATQDQLCEIYGITATEMQRLAPPLTDTVTLNSPRLVNKRLVTDVEPTRWSGELNSAEVVVINSEAAEVLQVERGLVICHTAVGRIRSTSGEEFDSENPPSVVFTAQRHPESGITEEIFFIARSPWQDRAHYDDMYIVTPASVAKGAGRTTAAQRRTREEGKARLLNMFMMNQQLGTDRIQSAQANALLTVAQLPTVAKGLRGLSELHLSLG